MYQFILFLFRVENQSSILNNKYRGKEFAVNDINNPDVFNIVELSDITTSSMYAYDYKTINLIVKGIEIIIDNDNFTLTLSQGIGPRGDASILINDKNKKTSYKIDWINRHHEDLICISNNDKQYCFAHLSQIEMYFDLKKEIGGKHNI